MLPEIKKILFATDLSTQSRHAFDYALSQAHAYGASIIFLHVLETSTADFKPRICNYLGRDIWQRVDARKKENLGSARQLLIGKLKDHEATEQALAELNEEACRLLPQQTAPVDEVKIRNGRVVEEILKELAESSCDLIVMGPGSGLFEEKSGASKKIKGILHRSTKPTLIAPFAS